MEHTNKHILNIFLQKKILPLESLPFIDLFGTSNIQEKKQFKISIWWVCDLWHRSVDL